MSSPDAQALNWHYTELSDRDFEIQGRTLFFIAVLFSIMLLVALLILYVRWICGYQGQLPSNFGTGRARPAQPLPPPPPPPPPPLQGLDPVSIKKLPIILHQTPSDPMCALEATECCICLGPFKDGDKLKVLPGCDHSFHSECVDKWLASHSSCPLCRASLKVDFSFPKILIQEPPVRI